MLTNERTFSQKTGLFFKGLAMGGANKVPGVSGGMIAFVMGFYEELINTFRKLNLRAFKLLFSGRFKDFFRYTNMEFLLLVMTGSLFSYFSVSLVLDYLLKNYELFVWSWFFGLIIGSIYYISKNFKDWNYQSAISLFVGVSVGIAISLLTPAKENANRWFVFFCGIIGVSGMTLPGLSGSFILILLGNYVLLLVDSVNVLTEVLSQLLVGDLDFLKDAVKVRYLKIIGVFTLGSFFGLVSLSHLLGYVLKKWNGIVTAVIIGFISGSLGIVWPWKKTIYKLANGNFILDSAGEKIIESYQRYLPNIATSETWLAVGFILLGIFLILIIDYYGRKQKQ